VPEAERSRLAARPRLETEPADPVARAVEQIIEQLEERLDSIVAAIVETLRRDITDYRPLDADAALIQSVEAATRRTLQLVLRLWRERRRLSPGDRVVMGMIGTQRAEQGVDLESLLAGVRIGRGIGWTHTVEAARRIDAGPEAVRALGDMAALLFEIVDDIRDAMASGYSRVEDTRSKARERTRSQVFDDLLSGAFEEDDEIVVRARNFGFDLRRPHGLVLVTTARADQDRATIRTAVASLLPSLGNTADVSMTSDVTPHVVVVVPMSTMTWDEVTEAVQKMSRSQRVTAVLASPVAGARGLHAAYRRARDLLPIAVSVFRRPHVVEADELVVYQILRGSRAEDRDDFLQRTLGPVLHLPEVQRTPLLETLDALHEGSGHTETAAAMLGVHTNTVRYRIGRIHHLTGLRYDHPPDRFKLEVATILLRMAGGMTGDVAAVAGR
jgi:DNA-binding PucR family transcriptional regulator